MVTFLHFFLSLSSADESKGYFVQPTVILTKDPKSVTMREEIFGPVLTVRFGYWPQFNRDADGYFSQVYVFDDADFDQTLDLINTTSDYALTGAMCVPSALSLFVPHLISLYILASPPSAKH